MIRLRFAARPFLPRRPRTWIDAAEGWAIRRWTLGDISHVDIVMPDGRLLGARADGVSLRLPGYAPFRNVVIAEIPASAEQESAFYAFVLAQLGKPYDNLALIAFVFNRDWQREDRWTCSELPARGLEVAGVLPELYVPSSRVTPELLAAVVSAIPGRRLIREQAVPRAVTEAR